MKLKVRISYFYKAKVYDPADYPEEEVIMTDAEFDKLIEDNQCYYDESVDVHYTPDNRIGYSIEEFIYD